MTQVTKLFTQFHNDESGQDLLEYAMVLGAVLAAVVSGSKSISTLLADSITHIDSVITTTVSKVS